LYLAVALGPKGTLLYSTLFCTVRFDLGTLCAVCVGWAVRVLVFVCALDLESTSLFIFILSPLTAEEEEDEEEV
jgi:hypothetical protein